MIPPTELLSVSVKAATEGAQQVLAFRGKVHAQQKGRHDFVTEADFASQQAIERVIADHFPDHAFVGEESTEAEAQPNDGWQWLVDPLDGTTNYLHTLPYYAVSVAAVHDSKVIAATVLDPERNECFCAARGMGATLNDKPIQTSGTDQLEQALLAFSLPANVQPDDPSLADVLGIAARCRAVRRLGAAALNLCYVAAGRLDGYWARSLQPWDMAAGSLIAAEAGGCVRSIGKNRVLLHQPSIIAAASDRLHDQIRQSIR